MYGAAAYGLLGSFTAITRMLVPIAALSYPLAIVLPRQDADARGIVRLSVYAALGTSALFFITLSLSGRWLLGLINLQAIDAFILLIPLVMLFDAFKNITKNWIIRKKQFGTVARVSTIQAFVENSAKVGIGRFYPFAAVLIILNTAAEALYALLLFIGIKKAEANNKVIPQESEPRKSIGELARKYYDFPLYRSPQAFIRASSESLPVVALLGFFGAEAAGFYSLGRMALGLPYLLLGESFGNVFYQHIAEAFHNKENLTRHILKGAALLAIAGAFLYGTVVVFGPWLFGFVFGSGWVTAGQYARWMALWLFFEFINIPSTAAIPMLSIQRFFLVYEIVSVIIRLGAIGAGFYLFKSDIAAVALFSIAGVALNLSLLTITCVNSNRKAGYR